MNNDPLNSTSDHLLTRTRSEDDGIRAEEQRTADAAGELDRQRKKRIQGERRAEFLDHLIRNIDIMIYCELSTLYYLDQTISLFLLRALPQWFYFTPKPLFFHDPLTQRPYVGAIFGTNILCIILHIYSRASEAGEAVRGYIHGGLFVDFVGQQGPISKFKLVSFDLLTFILQLVILAVTIERVSLRAEAGGAAVGVSRGTSDQVGEPLLQDLDSEERGVFRSDAAGGEDIELQTLAPRSATDRQEGHEDGGRDELLAEPSALYGHDTAGEHPLDSFNTGERVIANLHVLETVRSQWFRYRHVTAVTSNFSTSNPDSASAALAATEAGRRLGFRVRVGANVT